MKKLILLILPRTPQLCLPVSKCVVGMCSIQQSVDLERLCRGLMGGLKTNKSSSEITTSQTNCLKNERYKGIIL